MATKTVSFAKIKAHLDATAAGFEGRAAQAGWFATAERYPNGMSVAEVALIQESGAPARGIPPRPFLKPAINDNKQAWIKNLSLGIRETGAGRMNAEDVLEKIGGQMAGDIRKAITSEPLAPLSAITLVLRKWRRQGRTITGATVGEAAAAYDADPSIVQGVSDTPLNDTGKLIATLTHAAGDSQ